MPKSELAFNIDRAKDAIVRRMEADLPAPDIIDLMNVAREFVDTYNRVTRMELRGFIVAMGGSLDVPLERMRRLSLHPNRWVDRCKVKARDTSRALRYADLPRPDPFNPKPPIHCRFPVGPVNPFHPSESLCCGKPIPDVYTTVLPGAIPLVSFYCDECAATATERGTATNKKAPPRLPPSRRFNLALNQRSGQATSRYG